VVGIGGMNIGHEGQIDTYVQPKHLHVVRATRSSPTKCQKMFIYVPHSIYQINEIGDFKVYTNLHQIYKIHDRRCDRRKGDLRNQ
jgi:hypothetical protein